MRPKPAWKYGLHTTPMFRPSEPVWSEFGVVGENVLVSDYTSDEAKVVTGPHFEAPLVHPQLRVWWKLDW
jgi:hypothetical protein